MAALALNSIRLSTLAVAAALALTLPALAGDVSVKLDAGTGFSVKNSTGATERLRIDEATGNVSRNGALFVHTTGTSSTFVGAGAGNTAATGLRRNSAFGQNALRSVTGVYSREGTGNSAFGADALRDNTTGFYNSAFGASALSSSVLSSNATGAYNSAVGYRALQYGTAGAQNSAFGFEALRWNYTGSANTALGMRSLLQNATGRLNSAVGYASLLSNATGDKNTAVGSYALQGNFSGTYNSAFGFKALLTNRTGVGNSAFGNRTLGNAYGNFNSAFGMEALHYNNTGEGNTALGRGALFLNTTGSYNIAVGASAGSAQTIGRDNIYLADPGVAGENSTIRIGRPGEPPGTQTRAFMAGIRGVTTDVADAIPVLIDSAGQLGTVSSSRNVKKEIRDMGDATDRLLELRPVTFRYKQEQTLPDGREVPPEYGLIAEEVAEVFPDLVLYDEKGQPFTVKYHEMAPMLLNEMKKEHRANLEQEQSIAKLEAQQRTIETQQQQIAALTTRLAQLETRVIGTPGEAQR